VSCNYIPISTPAVFPDGGQSRATCEENAGQLKALNRENPNPFLVALVLDESQFCSGTLISRYHVLTSAHCTDQVERIELLFGTTDLNTNDIGVQKRAVKAVAVTAHPLFNPKTGANDISIITLTEPVIYTSTCICLHI
jgi:secreted trypsin-like serine protease